jgi:hypothetical protein
MTQETTCVHLHTFDSSSISVMGLLVDDRGAVRCDWSVY